MRKVIRAAWAAAFAMVAASAALSVHASTFTITSSTSGSNQAGFVTTFSVSRSGEGTNSFEKVNFRTASLSAYAGQHFTPTNGVLDFVPGETNKSVAVREYAAGADAYRYQRSNFQRSYRFEIDDSQGSFLKSLERARSVGTGINTNSVFAVQDLTITNGTITVTDGGYAQAHHDVSVSSYYSAAAPANYLVAAGATLRMTVTFDAREKDDGYQYIQIYANTTADDSHTDTGAKNGNPGDYNYARYVAGFTIDGNVSSTYYPYTFPLTSTNHNCGA